MFVGRNFLLKGAPQKGGRSSIHMRRAFAISLGIHMAVAFIIPLWPAQLSPGPEAVETLSFAHIAHIHIEKHADPRPLPVAMPKTKRRSPVVSFERKHSELS